MIRPSKPEACLFVLSGPCGTGKTSLANALRELEPDIGYIRSVTTRAPRTPTEDHYDWVDREEFIRMIHDGEFIQWINPAYNEFYGTRREPIEESLAQSRDLVFDYCPEGTLNLARLYPNHVVTIFVMAPSLDVMQDRLKKRGSESIDEQELRYQMALQDLNFVNQHDYHVVNDDFQNALAQIRAIRVAEKCRLTRQPQVVENYAHYAAPALLRYYEAPQTLDPKFKR